MDEQLIDELDAKPASRDDERRRYYTLTKLGRAVLEAEAARLDQQVREARARRLIRKAER